MFSAEDRPSGRTDEGFQHRFDQYLIGKSRFSSHLTLGPDQNPGLVSFRRFFDRGKILPRGASERLRRERHQRLSQYALESPGLAGIESLRMT